MLIWIGILTLASAWLMKYVIKSLLSLLRLKYPPKNLEGLSKKEIETYYNIKSKKCKYFFKQGSDSSCLLPNGEWLDDCCLISKHKCPNFSIGGIDGREL